MSGEAYVRRYPGGFVDLPQQTTAIDSQFLNAAEAALVRLLGEDPTDGEVGVWSTTFGRLVYQLLTNAQIAPGAAISRTKLDFGVGLVDADIAPGAAISSSKITGLTGTSPPSGGMMLYGGTVAPSGWLMCDGSVVSRTTQAGIFSVIGTFYGAGDGSTTFALPDYRGRFPVGVGTHADVGAPGANDGQAVGTRRPRHSHSAAGATLPNHGHSITDPGHVHTQNLYATAGGAAGHNNAVALTAFSSTIGDINSAFTGITVGNPTSLPAINGTVGAVGMTDSGGYLAANVIIKT